MDGKRPTESLSMSAVAFLENARGWARTLEDREIERSQLDSAEEARPIVSRHTGVPVGTLRSLRKKRLKSIPVHLYEWLRVAIIRELEAELRHVEHELKVARQIGLDPRSDAHSALVADIASVRAALGLDPASGKEGGG